MQTNQNKSGFIGIIVLLLFFIGIAFFSKIQPVQHNSQKVLAAQIQQQSSGLRLDWFLPQRTTLTPPQSRPNGNTLQTPMQYCSSKNDGAVSETYIIEKQFDLPVCMIAGRCDPSFEPIPSEYLSGVIYRDPFREGLYGRGLEAILGSPTFIKIIAGSADGKVYVMTGNNDLPPGIDSQKYYSNLDLFAKIDDQTEFIRVVVEAAKVWNSFTFGGNREIGVVDIPYWACEDGNYHLITHPSPLIYLYPEKEIKIAIQMHSPVISTSLKLTSGQWQVTASSDGTLTTSDDNTYRFIPYEFFRTDFKRPSRGFIVQGDTLELFLKTSLWKQLGLSNQEILDYWQDTKPRVPKSSYYFVSLIERSEIDRVLPMEVNPRPDTIIRNMTYILPVVSSFIAAPLEKEKLIAPKRNGFTVLENGVFVDGF